MKERQRIIKNLNKIINTHPTRGRLNEKGETFEGRKLHYYCSQWTDIKRQFWIYDTEKDVLWHVTRYKGRAIPSDDPTEVSWSAKTMEGLHFDTPEHVKEHLPEVKE